MHTKKKISTIRILMLSINLIMTLFMGVVIINASTLICWKDSAREFLEKIKYVPRESWKVPTYSIVLLSLFAVSMFYREKVSRKRKQILTVLSIIDIIICIVIMFIFNLSYNGIFLLAIANIIYFIEGGKRRLAFLVAAVSIYIVLDYDIISIYTNMFSIYDYIDYYNTIQKIYILGLQKIIVSVNQVVFIIFMVFIIQIQIEENKKITQLYDKLYKTAEELRVVNIQLNDYAQKSGMMAKMRERNRLAREIHDTIGHYLTGIATGLEACMELIDVNVEKTKLQISKIRVFAEKGLLDVRRSVKELRPDMLERFTLIPAIQKLSDDINECTRTKVCLNVECPDIQLSEDEEETVYRVIQESITNAVRHGNATQISVSLAYNNDMVHFRVEDDGKGCKYVQEGFGLKHIREKVLYLQGKLDYSSGEQKGFQVSGEIPIRRKVMQ